VKIYTCSLTTQATSLTHLLGGSISVSHSGAVLSAQLSCVKVAVRKAFELNSETRERIKALTVYFREESCLDVVHCLDKQDFSFLKIRFNIFLPSTPMYPKWYPPLRFSHLEFCTYFSSYPCVLNEILKENIYTMLK
jgi:hypothetical protein